MLLRLAICVLMISGMTGCSFFDPPKEPELRRDVGGDTNLQPSDGGMDTPDVTIDTGPPCDTDEECGGEELVCENRVCIPQQCEPLTQRCRGDALERCDSRGVEWQHVVECAIACTDGICERPQCELSNNGVEICDGLDNNCNGVRDEAPCPELRGTIALCTGAEGCAYFCRPGWFNLDGDMASNGCEAMCRLDEDCEEAHFCDAGFCIRQVCEPGATRCVSEGLQALCVEDGRYEAVILCALGCVDTRCATDCDEEADCGPNRRCVYGSAKQKKNVFRALLYAATELSAVVNARTESSLILESAGVAATETHAASALT